MDLDRVHGGVGRKTPCKPKLRSDDCQGSFGYSTEEVHKDRRGFTGGEGRGGRE